eukprot:Seg2100.8 transcript_id=Seg2100.8/GoldUCD/mRNA.D3Y31 product="hypothetical protein" protein_id=Seg2100.8/GoldUCD/D3Y31
MASAFSSKAEDVFTKNIEIGYENEVKDELLEEYYEIDTCVKFITQNSYEKVALQFPDELLKDSFKLSKIIESKCQGQNIKLHILGDTSYGSCCVDEIAAEHVNADCIIHFGRACLSKTGRLPLLFIFGNQPLDVNDCCMKFRETFEDSASQVLMFYDVLYQHSIDSIYDSLKNNYSNLVVSNIKNGKQRKGHKRSCKYGCGKVNENPNAKSGCSNQMTANVCCSNQNEGNECQEIRISKLDIKEKCNCNEKENKENLEHERFGRTCELKNDTILEDYKIFYIGKESMALTNLMMSYNKNTFYSYDPEQRTTRQETLNVNKALMKRYFLIQKAKEAQSVGIVAGTLGVADYLVIIERLKKLLKQAGKKFYTFMMGKPNVPKMANFMEIDVFVLVACPENSLINSQEFYRPIVTPFEMEIACSRAREWTGEYITDFRELLPGAASHVDLEENAKASEEEPEYSLISGNLITKIEADEAPGPGSSKDIALRNQENTVATFGENSAAHYLHTRSWQGLERKLGETEVIDAIEGRSGIAMGYSHEPEIKTKD